MSMIATMPDQTTLKSREGGQPSLDGAAIHEEIRLGNKTIPMQWKPFPFFSMPNFVSPELYAKLIEEFPTEADMPKKVQNGKFFINCRDLTGHEDAFFRNRPHWAAVVEGLRSQAFLDDLSSLLRSSFLTKRPPVALQNWKIWPGPYRALLDRPVQVTYEFSSTPPGAYLNPHTDKFAKIATFVWHFPLPEWDDSCFGPTEFYAPKNPIHNVNWSNYKLPYSAVDVIGTNEAKANTIGMFAKTDRSWHGVPAIVSPNNVPRRCFIFNFSTPIPMRNHFWHRGWEALHRRSENWRHRDFADVNRKPKADA